MKKGDLVKLKGDDTGWFGYGIIIKCDGSRLVKVLWSEDAMNGRNNNPDPFVDANDDWLWNTNLVLVKECKDSAI
jgi:hypothetical protein